jgi:hypothetical protein
MEAKIEALEQRTSGALFFLLGNLGSIQHIASQRVHKTGCGSVIFLGAAAGDDCGFRRQQVLGICSSIDEACSSYLQAD